MNPYFINLSVFYSPICHFKKDINVRPEIGVMLPSSFDGKDSDELTVERIVHGPPEYSQWESRN